MDVIYIIRSCCGEEHTTEGNLASEITVGVWNPACRGELVPLRYPVSSELVRLGAPRMSTVKVRAEMCGGVSVCSCFALATASLLKTTILFGGCRGGCGEVCVDRCESNWRFMVLLDCRGAR